MTIGSGRRLLCALATAAILAPAAPAAAQISGGAEAPQAARGVVSADGPVAIVARSGSMLGRVARFRGTAPAGEAGRAITVERFDEPTQTWTPLATATVALDGSYVVHWRTDSTGRHRVRAVLQRPGAASAAIASSELEITVHRPATATWYGPGFFGRQTGCGLKMTRTLLGVAHRRLPCGTQVALLYRGRTITVPVVDRGPFRRGVRWDLTAATAQAIGFEFTDRVGAVQLAPPLPIG